MITAHTVNKKSFAVQNFHGFHGFSIKRECFLTKIDMSKAADLVTATLETLQCFRSDDEWVKVYKYVNDVATLNEVSITPQRSQRQCQTPSQLSDFTVMETTSKNQKYSNKW